MELAFLIEMIGALGAVLTTLCRLPQALKVFGERETRALSRSGIAVFTLGKALWLFYGLAIHDWRLIGSSAATLGLMAPIIAMKLRHNQLAASFSTRSKIRRAPTHGELI